MELTLNEADKRDIANMVIAGLQQKTYDRELTSEEAMKMIGYKTYAAFKLNMDNARIKAIKKAGINFWKESDINKFIES